MKETGIKVDSTFAAVEKDKAPVVTPVIAIENPPKAKPSKNKYPYIRKLSERSTNTAKTDNVHRCGSTGISRYGNDIYCP
jgi:hypothetical protein